MNGKIIHHKIIENVTTMYSRGSEKMQLFIQERYIDHSIHIDDRLSATTRLKLCDPFQEDERQKLTRKRNSHTDSSNKLFNKIVKTADYLIKNIISISHFRVSSFFYMKLRTLNDKR